MAAYDNHVLPFLWLKGEAHETITEYLEQIAGADIREVCLESRTHPEFCRDGWWADLRFIIGECKRLGLKIWLLDDAHFPTGYANGALADEDVDPALKKTVLKHRTVTVVGPQPSTVIKLGNLMDPTGALWVRRLSTPTAHRSILRSLLSRPTAAPRSPAF